MSRAIPAFMLALLAGLSTGIGGGISLAAGRDSRGFLGVSLGFSAGVMIYVSLVEILLKAQEALSAELGAQPGGWTTAAGLFGGMTFIALVERFIPSTPDARMLKRAQCDDAWPAELMRMGAFTALAIALHNFPEGLATFVSALNEPGLGIPIVAAIAIHNIPEGIAVAAPVYQATGSRAKAFWLALASGLAEPVGAMLGWLVLMPVMNDAVFGVVFAGVAGIMVFISFDELLPAACEYGGHRRALGGLILGMAVMAVSLVLFM